MSAARPKITISDEHIPERMTHAARNRLLWLLVITAAVIGAYANSLQGPFIFDDVGSITDNASIRHLGTAFVPAHGSGQTVEARPILNLSLAFNYAIGGSEVKSYHVLNLLIHLAAALCLFELLRLSFNLPSLRKRFSRDGLTIAGVTALLWGVHPLQSESVTYIVQRAESLTGLFFLASFYSLVRSEDDPNPGLWRFLSVVCVFLGIGTKEIMITAVPLLALFEATFFSTTFTAAFKKHRLYYLGLGASVLSLGVLLASTGGNRSGSIGFGIGISPFKYFLTQPQAILTYLKLCFFPYPLILDYGAEWVVNPLSVAPFALLVAVLLAASILAVVRFSRSGFIAVWFWVILAPTSSLIPGNRQTIAEHRMYLPLAAVLLGLVIMAAKLLSRKQLIGFALSLAVVFATLTALRNRDYTDLSSLWGDTVTHRPNNPYALNNYGYALANVGRTSEAAAALQKSLEVWPTYAEAHFNLGALYAKGPQKDEALAQYRQAVSNKPHYAEAEYNLALLLIDRGRPQEAIEPLLDALATKPGFADAHTALGNAYAALGQASDAINQFNEALRLDPENAEGMYNLGITQARTGQVAAGIDEAEKGLALKPQNASGQYHVALLLAQSGQLARALPHFEAAVQADPTLPEAQLDYGNALIMSGKPTEALEHYQEAVRLRPNFPQAYFNMGNVYARAGRMGDAVEEFNLALKYRPDYAEAKKALAYAQQAAGLTP